MSPFVAAVLAVVAAAALPALSAWLAGWKPAHARGMLRRGALLVDVVTRRDFGADDVSGAVNILSDEVARRQCRLGDHARPTLIYSRSHVGSAVAAQTLRGIGFHEVLNMGTLNQAKSLSGRPGRRRKEAPFKRETEARHLVLASPHR